MFSYVKELTEKVVGVRAYRKYREKRGTSSDTLRDKLVGVDHGIGQVIAPLSTRITEEDPKTVLASKGAIAFIVLSIAADLGVHTLLTLLAFMGGEPMKALALKAAYNIAANATFDVMRARARQPSSAPQT